MKPHCLRCTSYKHKTADCLITKHCENCFSTNHSLLQCRFPPNVRCDICFRANTKTEDCDCENQSLVENMQGLRLVGDDFGPVPLIDVHVYTIRYAALVAPSQTRTYISTKVSEDYDALQNVTHLELHHREQRVGLELHISIENRLILHPCLIKTNQMPYDVILGMDFLRKFGFSLSVGKFTINKFSPIFSTDTEVQYWKRVIIVNGPSVQPANAKEARNGNHGVMEVDPDVESYEDDVLEIHPSFDELKLS